MYVKKDYEQSTPRKEGHHPYYGLFVCDPQTETEANLLSGFAEYWLGAGDSDFSVSFTPTMSKGHGFWVSAKTKDLVREIIDEGIGRLTAGLKTKGIDVMVEEECISTP